MKKIGVLTLAAAAMLVTGCGREEAGLEGEDDRTAYEALATAADTAEGFESSNAAPVVPVQGAAGPAGVSPGGPLTATGNLEGIAEGAPPGAVTVTESGGGTTVLIDITRYTAGTQLAASLVRGSCDEAGVPVSRIGQPFTIQQSGIGRLQATIGTPTRQMLDGRHSIRVHTPGGDAPDMVLACADLPALQS